MSLRDELSRGLAVIAAPAPGSGRADNKNYTEKLSHFFTAAVATRLAQLGLDGVRAPRGRDKQFMGGYGPKGVDVYLSDEKHGLLLASGTKGILYNITKNLKNRYRDLVMEALELHKRFPYAVCGHLLFLRSSEVARPSQAFGTVLGEAVALLSNIAGRERPEDAAETYEVIGVVLLEPGDSESIQLAPPGVPEDLLAATYCERLVEAFKVRNPFYRS